MKLKKFIILTINLTLAISILTQSSPIFANFITAKLAPQIKTGITNLKQLAQNNKKSAIAATAATTGSLAIISYIILKRYNNLSANSIKKTISTIYVSQPEALSILAKLKNILLSKNTAIFASGAIAATGLFALIYSIFKPKNTPSNNNNSVNNNNPQQEVKKGHIIILDQKEKKQEDKKTQTESETQQQNPENIIKLTKKEIHHENTEQENTETQTEIETQQKETQATIILEQENKATQTESEDKEWENKINDLEALKKQEKELNKKIEDKRQEQVKLEAENKQKIETLTNTLTIELDKLKQQHQEEISKQEELKNKNLQEKIQELENKYKEDSKKLDQENERIIKNLKDSHKKRLDRQKSQTDFLASIEDENDKEAQRINIQKTTLEKNKLEIEQLLKEQEDRKIILKKLKKEENTAIERIAQETKNLKEAFEKDTAKDNLLRAGLNAEISKLIAERDKLKKYIKTTSAKNSVKSGKIIENADEIVKKEKKLKEDVEKFEEEKSKFEAKIKLFDTEKAKFDREKEELELSDTDSEN